MINNVVLVGRLTRDPELKTTQQQTSVCSFSIAVDRNFVRQGEERQADFINIVTWQKTAEFVNKYFTKGKLIGIEGSLQSRRYTDKDGNTRTAYEVVASKVSFIGSKNDSGNTSAANTYDVGQGSDFSPMGVPEDDDDLPF